MINHTMIVSFDQPLPATELDQYLADIERVMLDSGFVRSVVARRHIPVPGEEAIPALIATAIVQIALADSAAPRRSGWPGAAPRSPCSTSTGARRPRPPR
ncbi:hypothetical protein [Streptomyces malaysiensis]|uniref:Uncharacterized protein n=1 Tax=Streptomyces malaysiensis TaxID=92644 RepID=A0A2J7Z6C8_STRMQ|nr:hypothetical protein [Streptomyces malaysiensis]PNG95828.1 hypothetical protein SMF913_11853 [Streptomyces malaysiensis]